MSCASIYRGAGWQVLIRGPNLERAAFHGSKEQVEPDESGSILRSSDRWAIQMKKERPRWAAPSTYGTPGAPAAPVTVRISRYRMNSGARTSVTVASNFTRTWSDGPAVSLKGSPTV